MKRVPAKRNPVARALRLLGKRIVPSRKIYSRKRKEKSNDAGI